MPRLPNFGTYLEKPAGFVVILSPAANDFET
jgi:hypothetical protein